MTDQIILATASEPFRFRTEFHPDPARNGILHQLLWDREANAFLYKWLYPGAQDWYVESTLECTPEVALAIICMAGRLPRGSATDRHEGICISVTRCAVTADIRYSNHEGTEEVLSIPLDLLEDMRRTFKGLSMEEVLEKVEF